MKRLFVILALLLVTLAVFAQSVDLNVKVPEWSRWSLEHKVAYTKSVIIFVAGLTDDSPLVDSDTVGSVALRVDLVIAGAHKGLGAHGLSAEEILSGKVLLPIMSEWSTVTGQ